MGKLALNQPDESSTPSGGSPWVTTAASIPLAWDEINNGIATPVDAERISCGAAEKTIDLKMTDVGAPASLPDPIDRAILNLRYQGVAGLAAPALLIELWTDYPTTLARKVGDKTFDMTQASMGNKSFSISSISMTRDEWLARRWRLISKADAGSSPDEFETPE